LPLVVFDIVFDIVFDGSSAFHSRVGQAEEDGGGAVREQRFEEPQACVAGCY